MKRNRTILAILMILFFASMLVMQASADEDTTIFVVITGDGNVTGYINGTAINGSVSYYIDGIEVASEFSAVWNAITRAQRSAIYAHGVASSAWMLARANNASILLVTADAENNTARIYLLRDELVAFENEYMLFKDDTDVNITGLKVDDMRINLRINSALDAMDKLDEKLYNLTLCFIFTSLGALLLFVYVVLQLHKKKPPKKHPKKEKKTSPIKAPRVHRKNRKEAQELKQEQMRKTIDKEMNKIEVKSKDL